MVISNPKTDESQAPVHVEPQLRIILNRWKMTQTKKLGDKLENRAVNDCWMFPASESRTRRNEREHEDLLYAAGMPTMQPSTHLHRKEGDEGNAAYWYSRAGKPVCRESLNAEWLSIVRGLLG